MQAAKTIEPPTFLESLRRAFREHYTFAEYDDGFHIIIEKSPDTVAFFSYFLNGVKP